MTTAWNSVMREDLIRWANDEATPARLPELIRRLVLETANGVESIDFPGGGAVTTGGFDGYLRATGATAFVPAGTSVWELSTRKTRPTEKADEDYEKRLQTPDFSPIADATYIQVIARPWKDANTWAARRSAEKRWRLVRGHNVDWLTTWLEQAPATRMWLLGLLDDVAGLIGRLDDDQIDRGLVLVLRIRNERGVTSRGLTDGGNQERELAATYRASARRFASTEPRVATLLNAVAESHEDEAREHDADAERHRRGLDL